MRRLLSVGLLCVLGSIGCVEKSATAIPVIDSKQIEFNTAVRHYLSEARASVKLAKTNPTLGHLKEKEKLLKDLLSHLPDPPRELKGFAVDDLDLNNIAKSFSLAVQFLELKNNTEFDDCLDMVSRCANRVENKLDGRSSLSPMPN